MISEMYTQFNSGLSEKTVVRTTDTWLKQTTHERRCTNITKRNMVNEFCAKNRWSATFLIIGHLVKGHWSYQCPSPNSAFVHLVALPHRAGFWVSVLSDRWLPFFSVLTALLFDMETKHELTLNRIYLQHPVVQNVCLCLEKQKS